MHFEAPLVHALPSTKVKVSLHEVKYARHRGDRPVENISELSKASVYLPMLARSILPHLLECQTLFLMAFTNPKGLALVTPNRYWWLGIVVPRCRRVGNAKKIAVGDWSFATG